MHHLFLRKQIRLSSFSCSLVDKPQADLIVVLSHCPLLYRVNLVTDLHNLLSECLHHLILTAI